MGVVVVMTIVIVVMMILVIMIVVVQRAWCVVLRVRCIVRRAQSLVDIELDGREAGAQHARRANLVSGHGEAAQCLFQVVERQTGIQERPQQHVARDSRETIQIQNP